MSGLIAQFLKIFTRAKGQKLNYKDLYSYSGMPSGHTAMVISLATIIGLELGFDSAMFALAVVFAIIVIRDAVGFRRYLGQHGKILNILVKDLEEDQLLDKSYPKLLEKIGHTPLQVLAGGLIGLVVSIIGYLVF